MDITEVMNRQMEQWNGGPEMTHNVNRVYDESHIPSAIREI